MNPQWQHCEMHTGSSPQASPGTCLLLQCPLGDRVEDHGHQHMPLGSMFIVAMYQVHLWRKYVFTFYAVFLKFCRRYLLLAFFSPSCLHLVFPEGDYLDFFTKPMGFVAVWYNIHFLTCSKLVPDIFSDPCLKTLLLGEDESLFSSGSYGVKTLSSWGIWFYRIYFLLPEGKKNRSCKPVEDLAAFENLLAL